MKLIVQIPCYNEEHFLPLVLGAIPREIKGIDSLQTLVVDDGSDDRSTEVAKACNVSHILKLKIHQGLAGAFMSGINEALRLGADIIVNIDADNQYKGEDIAKLIEPILRGEADIVIGSRDIGHIIDFSWFKKKSQRIGSWVVRQLSGTEVEDVTSGFRAFSREAALRLNIFSKFTYTLELIIQAGKKNIKIKNIKVETNKPLRKSRLFKNNISYIRQSIATIIRIYAMYEPLKVFFSIGLIVFSIGSFLSLRFIYFFFAGLGSGHVQSLIFAAVFIILGFLIALIGLLADLIAANRKLLEDSVYRIKKRESTLQK